MSRERCSGSLVSSFQLNEAPIMMEETTDNKIESRLNVLDELLNTERDYLRDLCYLVDNYLVALQENKLVSFDSLSKMFSNIEAIRDLHQSIYNQLDEKISDIRLVSTIEYSISEIFASNAERLKNYVTFSTHYKHAVSEVKLQKQQSPAFAQFINDKQSADPKKLRITDYLIKPIQRLCKYPLIFRELLKSTPEDHKHRPFMQETMDSLGNLTDHVNECSEQAENEEQLREIELELSGFDGHLVLPGRQLLKQGSVFVSVEKEKLKTRRLMVFNDMIMIVKPKSKLKYQFVTMVESNCLLFAPVPILTKLKSVDSLSPSGSPRSAGAQRMKKKKTLSRSSMSNLIPPNPELSFQLINVVKKEKYTIQCGTLEEKVKWEKVMDRCCATPENASLSVEEQLKREKAARIKLQQKNAELYERIQKLEKSLATEVALRRSLQQKNEKKA